MAQDGRAVTVAILAYTIIGFSRLASADSTCLHCGEKAEVSPFRQHFRSIRDDSQSTGGSVSDQTETGDSELVKSCAEACLRLAQGGLTGSLLDGNLPERISNLSSWLKSFVQDSFTIEEETNSIRRKRQAWEDYHYSYKNYGLRPEYETRVDDSARNDPVIPGRSYAQYRESVDKMGTLSNNIERERIELDKHKERSECLAKQQELLSDVLNLLDQIVENTIEHLDSMVREEIERGMSKVAPVKSPIWWVLSLQQNNFIFPHQQKAKSQLKKPQTIVSEKRFEEESLSADSETDDTSRANAVAFATSASPGNWYSNSMSNEGNWYPYQNTLSGQNWYQHQTTPSEQETWYSYANPSSDQWWYAIPTSPDGSGVQVAVSNDNGGASEMGSESSYNPVAVAASSPNSAVASTSSQNSESISVPSHYPVSVSATSQHAVAAASSSSYRPQGGGLSSSYPVIVNGTHYHPVVSTSTLNPSAETSTTSEPQTVKPSVTTTTSKPSTVRPPAAAITTFRPPGVPLETSNSPIGIFGPEPDTTTNVFESTESPYTTPRTPETTIGLLNTTPRVTEAAETTTVFKTTTVIHVPETTTPVPKTTTRKPKMTAATQAPETTTLLHEPTTIHTPETTTEPLEATSEVPAIETSHPTIITDEEVPTQPPEVTTRFESTTYFTTTTLNAIDVPRTESEELLFRSHNITVPRNAEDDPDCDKLSPATRFLPSILEVFKLKAK